MNRFPRKYARPEPDRLDQAYEHLLEARERVGTTWARNLIDDKLETIRSDLKIHVNAERTKAGV